MLEHNDPARQADAAAAPLIESRGGFHAGLRWWLDQARGRGARELFIVDPDFAEWPLDDQAILDGLTAWLQQPMRRLHMLAAGYETIERVHPRFTAWRVHWAHAIDARRPSPELTLELPSLAVDDGPTVLQLLDRQHWRGRVGHDARDAKACREQLDALMQHSEAAWPTRALGL